jgi:hypothetical protein
MRSKHLNPMFKKLIYHLFLIVVFLGLAFTGQYYFTNILEFFNLKNTKNSFQHWHTLKPIYLTKAPRCDEIEGLELPWGTHPPQAYSGTVKFCNDSSGNVLAFGKVINGKYEGVHLNYHVNGTFSDKRFWVNGKREGIHKFYENGHIKCKGLLENGMQQGEWKWYEENKLITLGTFKNGKREGEWKWYEENKLITLGTYKNGKAEGKWKEYNLDGTIKSETTFKNDVFQECEGDCDEN